MKIKTMNLLIFHIAVYILFYFPGNMDKSYKYVNDVMKISSSAFENGAMIPAKYTCDGQNISPSLEWSGFPGETESFVIICDDPDAPGKVWVHWVIYNIPKHVNSLEEDVPSLKVLTSGAIQGKNDFGKIGYGGPCPPSGTHRYYFKIYALDVSLPDTPGLKKSQVLDEIEGHVLEEAQLIGKYSR